jgi:hypothetical protein
LSKLKAKALQQLGLGETLYYDEDLNPIQEFTPISSLPWSEKNTNLPSTEIPPWVPSEP